MSTETDTPAVAAAPPNLDNIVEKYIILRDRKAALKAKYDADVACIERGLEKCEFYFLTQMNRLGLESLPTVHGVPYKSKRTSATVADPAMFRAWVIENVQWHMLDIKANKTAVVAYKEEHEDLPPGLNWREEVIVNVRKK